MTEQTSSEETIQDPETSSGRNPLIIFAGLLILGSALALLLFGPELFRSGRNEGATVQDTAALSADSDSSQSVLDQVIKFPTSESVVAELPLINPGGTLEIGDKAHNFTLLDLDGNPVSLDDFEGQPIIINFWATWCAPCRIEMPELQTAYEAYQDQGLVILALNEDEPVDIAREYFKEEMGLTFTALQDEDSVIATTFGNFGTLPTTFFINPDGDITVIHRGPMTFSQIEGYLAETIPG